MNRAGRLLLTTILVLIWGGVVDSSAYYDPKAGKWLSRDPIQEKGGVNVTAFCRNDPVNNVDPDGRAPWDSNRTRVQSEWRVNPETGEPEVARWRMKLEGGKLIRRPVWQQADGLERQLFFARGGGRWVVFSRAEGRERHRQWVAGTLPKSRDQFMTVAMTYPALVGGGGGAPSLYSAGKAFALKKLLPPLLPFLEPIGRFFRATVDKLNDYSLRLSVCQPLECVNKMQNSTRHIGNYQSGSLVRNPYVLPTVGDFAYRTAASPAVQAFSSGFSQDVPLCYIQPTPEEKVIWWVWERLGDWSFSIVDPNAPWGEELAPDLIHTSADE